ncbi:hypothetical protein SCLCIDRAFT_1223007, partial [Scleroderma citrinum Foug A]
VFLSECSSKTCQTYPLQLATLIIASNHLIVGGVSQFCSVISGYDRKTYCSK